MKKIFTMDIVVASLFGAIGYGGTYFLLTHHGFNMLFSTVICMIVGMFFDWIADKMIVNKTVQQSSGKKYAVYTVFVLTFLTAYYVLITVYEHSLFVDFGAQLTFVTIIPAISFFISLGIRYLKKIRLIKKYGSGEYGFIFDQKVENFMKALNGENRELPKYSGKNPVVKTATGSYVGKKVKNGVSFLGIPYASTERWKKPMPMEASAGIYEAYYFGKSEIQPQNRHNALSYFYQGEDCLNLNVWTAKLEPQKNKPVFVYIHGGDGRYGGSANPAYHLENIASAITEAVFVSINYRFGLFGVVDFSSSGCQDAKEYADSTALSLLDQLEALKWIKANISAFGGNPENITVAGDSNGGACICMLATMEKAKGLFHRAIILDASLQDTPADDEKASLLGRKLLEEFHAKSIAELKSVTAKQLRDFSNRNYDLLEGPPRDNRVITQDISQAYRNIAASGVEFIFSFTTDVIGNWQGMTVGEVYLDEMMEEYYEELKKIIGIKKINKLDALLQKYIQSDLSNTEAKISLMADLQYRSKVLHDCKTLSRAGSKVRCFYWDVKGDIKKFTANTVSMTTAILGNLEIAEQMGYLHDKRLTEIMQALVSKFMRGESPEFFNNELKGVSKIVWDVFDVEKESVLHIQKNKISMTESAFSENVHELEKLVLE